MLEHTIAPSVSSGGRPLPLGLLTGLEAAPAAAGRPRARAWPALRVAERLDRLDAAAHRWLVAHSIALLRLSLGAVFLGFGVLKLFPGVSPAQSLVEATTHILTLGLVPGAVAVVGVGVLECVIGLCLIAGRALRGTIYLLGAQLVGILSPVVLLTHRLFMGPHNAPTLEGQYVLKDVILVGATLVLAATLRGGRLTSATDSVAAAPAAPVAPEV